WAKGPLVDSKGRRVPGILEQAGTLDYWHGKLKEHAPYSMFSYKEASYKKDMLGHEIPMTYTVKDPGNAPWLLDDITMEFHDLFNRLVELCRQAGVVVEFAWLPDWAPEAMIERLTERTFPKGERSAYLFQEDMQESILFIDDSGPNTSYEVGRLPRADFEYYEELAKDRKHSDRVANILWEAGERGNKDYKDLVMARLIAPSKAESMLKQSSQHLTLGLAAGMMNLMSPTKAMNAKGVNANMTKALDSAEKAASTAGAKGTEALAGGSKGSMSDLAPDADWDRKHHANDPGAGHYYDGYSTESTEGDMAYKRKKS
ncbi:MAG: hypothetical protein AAFX99_27250, partial [Myxococcota bacterium]